MTRHRLVVAAALALVVPLLAAVSTQAAVAKPAKGITFISFEDVDEVCGFINTTPLRGRYAAAKFSGPSAEDGGAVLDGCANYDVQPRTGDRFLAFNADSELGNGGIPRGPETIRLPVRQRKVVVWLSQGGLDLGEVTFKLVGKRKNKTLRSTTRKTDSASWVRLQIRHRKGFDRLRLSAKDDPGGTWLLDDLTMWR